MSFKESGSQNEGRREMSEPAFEVMSMPEIVFEIEWGEQLWSLLLKAEDPSWGGFDHSLSKESVVYFRGHPLSSEARKGLEELRDFGVDDESFANMALTYDHPGRLVDLIRMVKKHKPNISDPHEAVRKFIDIMKLFDASFSLTPLAQEIRVFLDQDRAARLEKVGETRQRIEKLIGFFLPDKTTTDIQKLNFMPTDPLQRQNTGRAFFFGDMQIIQSHIDNVANQDHEFLHGVINPIVDKLSDSLAVEEKETISRIANEDLKKDYGEEWHSLLCEELVRTYKEVFENGEENDGYEEFCRRIDTMSEGSFQRYYSENLGFRETCRGLDIATIQALREKKWEFFDYSVASKGSRLRDVILKIYQEYSMREDKKNVNFERFLLENFSKYLTE